MIKKEPVDLLHQTILSVIPVANLYAFYRIQKLRMLLLIYLVINIGATLGFTVVFQMALITINEDTLSIFVEMLQFLASTPMQVILFATDSLINIYLVRRWSKKWNEQLQNPKNDDPTTFTRFF